MAGTICGWMGGCSAGFRVSMESGLDGRNNTGWSSAPAVDHAVSMESGLDGRNNQRPPPPASEGSSSQWSPA